MLYGQEGGVMDREGGTEKGGKEKGRKKKERWKDWKEGKLL